MFYFPGKEARKKELKKVIIITLSIYIGKKIGVLKETKSATMNIFRFFFIFFLNHL